MQSISRSETSPEYVGLGEAASRLGCHERTVRRLIGPNGELKAYRLGAKVIRIDVADLDAVLVPIEPEQS